MAVTAAMVKELREMTGAGMMDCKKAVQVLPEQTQSKVPSKAIHTDPSLL